MTLALRGRRGAGSKEVDRQPAIGRAGGDFRWHDCLTTATTFSEHRRCNRGGPRPHGALTSCHFVAVVPFLTLLRESLRVPARAAPCGPPRRVPHVPRAFVFAPAGSAAAPLRCFAAGRLAMSNELAGLRSFGGRRLFHFVLFTLYAGTGPTIGQKPTRCAMTNPLYPPPDPRPHTPSTHPHHPSVDTHTHNAAHPHLPPSGPDQSSPSSSPTSRSSLERPASARTRMHMT